jgi:CheY-like chemotaxis protein
VHTLRGACGEGNEDPRNEYRLLEESDFSGYRVLLVEDNEIAASIALDILGMTGVEVERAENGKKAVEKVLSYEPGHFDLIFMDVQMPVMNGYQAATALREAAAGHGLNGEAITPRPDLRFIPIVALTADAFADDIARAHAAGMDAHMSKPMEIGLLIKTLQERLPGHKASQSGGEAYSRQFARDEINEETAIINSQQEKQETVGEPAAAGVGEPSAVEAESIELSAGAEKSAAGAESEHLPEGHKAEEEENTLPRDSK